MAKSLSGRIVLEVDPILKRRLHSFLDLSGKTMREWFIEQAETSLDNNRTVISEPRGEYGMPETFLNGKKRETSNLESMSFPNVSVISMFSGCGGMDLGFIGGFNFLGKTYGKNPFHIVWANEISPAACSTYRKNLRHEILEGDIWDHLASLPSKADVVIGGFPCQDISINGKREGVAGKRSGLYRAMVETVRRVRPKVFVAENVKGLLMEYNSDSLATVLNDFSSLGYNVSFQLYKAADYGVPQLRERVFIVGTRPDIGNFHPPIPSHTRLDWITAADAITDLEAKERDIDSSHIWSLAKKSPEQGGRILKPDRPSQTIRAECHGNIQFHYKLPRRISMREAARLQSFPDNFSFDCGLREMERQIGNAVPPVLAWHIARSVGKALSADQKAIPIFRENERKGSRKASSQRRIRQPA